jgi:hypothetical protein
VSANPGLIYAALHDLAEPLSAALLLGGLLSYVRGRRVAAAAAFGLLVLSKELYLLVPLAIAAWEAVRARKRIRHAWPVVVCILPAVCWWIYARVQLGAWFTSGGSAITFPLAGWKRSLLDNGVGTYAPDGALNVADEATLVVVAALLVVLAVVGLMALRLRSPIDVTYVVIGVVLACLAWNATTLLRDALRNVAVLLTLVPFVFAASQTLPESWRREPG